MRLKTLRHGKGNYGNCKPFWKYYRGYQDYYSKYLKYKHDITYNEELNQYEFKLEVPGLSRDKVKIKASKEFLFVEIDDRKNDEHKPTNLRFTFRQDVDIEKIKAKYNNGLITVEIPLKESQKYDINFE